MAPSPFDERLRAALLAWFDVERRPMPWRDAPTPYRVFLSEIMLQQTQVATVIPYFERFTERFPDWGALAVADLDEVLALWSGLGYYRRARSLHAAARVVDDEHGGELPADPAALLDLPGVGRYTAGAVASIAFGLPEPALDGNGIRLLTRLGALSGDPARQPLRGLLWDRLTYLVRGPRPGDLNQAVMELAARICRPANPDCAACPVAERCAARETGSPTQFPQLERPAAPQEVRLEVGIFRGPEGMLLARGDRPFLGELWNLPYRIVFDAAGFAAEEWRELGLSPGRTVELGEGRHTITRYRLRQRVLAGDATLVAGKKRVEYRWVAERELAAMGLPAFSRKLLDRYQ